MDDPVFIVDSWEPLFKVSDDLAVDRNGDFKIRMENNWVMDMDNGKLDYTTDWSADPDPFEDF